MRARGLKHAFRGVNGARIGSRPMRARGLKLLVLNLVIMQVGRAPCGRVD